MKKSKLRGYIYDLEHKNKNFSFDKTIRILDISNMIYIDLIKKWFPNAKIIIDLFHIVWICVNFLDTFFRTIFI